MMLKCNNCNEIKHYDKKILQNNCNNGFMAEADKVFMNG